MLKAGTIRKLSLCVAALIVLIGVILCGLLMPSYAADNAEAYELLKYDQVTAVQKNHEFDVTLNLQINAPEELREVRVDLPNGNFVLGDIHVADYDFNVVTDENGKQSIRIQSGEESFPSGKNDFTVNYVIRYYEDHNGNYDMLYYDALTPNWTVPITKLKMQIELPEDFDWSDLQYYAGQFGAQDTGNLVSYAVKNNTITLTGKRLPENYGITLKAQLEDGYWEGALDNSWTRIAAISVMLTALLLVILFWLIGGRDPRVRRTEEIHPIDGISTADISYLFYGRMRIRDIAILIVHLAIQGSLRIEEYQPKKYRLIRLREPKDEERYVRTAYNTLFEDVYEGRALSSGQLYSRLRAIRKIVFDSVESGYSAKNMRACTTLSVVLRYLSIIIQAISIGAVYLLPNLYNYQEVSFLIPIGIIAGAFGILYVINREYDMRYEIDAREYRIRMAVYIAAYAALLLYVTWQYFSITGSHAAGLIILLCGILTMGITLHMKARAKGNAVLVRRIVCLRRFMETVTPQELAKRHLDTEEYYYEMLPYALLFSMEESWARKFRWIGSKGAEFYEETESGNAMSNLHRENQTTEIIARSLKTFCRTIEGDYRMAYRRRRIF